MKISGFSNRYTKKSGTNASKKPPPQGAIPARGMKNEE
jgi:hypothetical protein